MNKIHLEYSLDQSRQYCYFQNKLNIDSQDYFFGGWDSNFPCFLNVKVVICQ